MKEALKNLTETKRSRNIFMIALFLVLAFLVFKDVTYAQTPLIDKSLKSYKKPANIKKYFEDKYKDQMDVGSLTSDLQETPQGPRGNLHISGHFKVKNVEETSNKADRARAIAKAFLRDEAELLGLPDLNELHEDSIATNMGHDGEYTSIYYTRYIGNLPLENSRIHIGIRPDESIELIDASLAIARSELYQAAAKNRLTKEEASKIVENDMKIRREAKKIKIGSASEVAIETAPYVIWHINVTQQDQQETEWGYTVDSITGRIVRKGKVQRATVD